MTSKKIKNNDFSIALEMREVLKTLLVASHEGNLQGLQKAINDYISTHNDAKVDEILFDFKDGHGKICAHFAAQSDQIEILRYLIQVCPQCVDAKDDEGNTPLMTAAQQGKVAAINFLLESGANVRESSKSGTTALHFAADAGHVELVELLVSAGADLNAQSSSGTPLHWSAGNNKPNVVAKLLQFGARVDSKNSSGVTPLIMAAAAQCEESTRLLIEAGADTGLILTGNVTILHMCADFGFERAVSKILETETGLKCATLENSNQLKPIHLAAIAGHRKVVELLMPHSNLPPHETIDSIMQRGLKMNDDMKSEEVIQKVEEPADHTTFEIPSNIELNEPRSDEDRQASERLKKEGNDLFQRKQWELALEKYQEAVKLDGRNHILWSNISACNMELQDYDNALLHAEICKKLNPTWSKAYYRVAVAKLALNRFEDAAFTAWEGVQIDNQNTTLQSLLKKAVDMGKAAHKLKNNTP